MKIALNGQSITTKTPAGPERFAINLYRELASYDGKNDYIVYFQHEPTTKEVLEIFENHPNFKYKILPTFLSWTHVNLLLQIIKDKPNIFFTPVHTIPFYKPKSTKYVPMIHGLEYKIPVMISRNNKWQSVSVPVMSFILQNDSFHSVPRGISFTGIEIPVQKDFINPIGLDFFTYETDTFHLIYKDEDAMENGW